MRCILRRCGVPPSTPHSGGFARRVPRNAGELFTLPSRFAIQISGKARNCRILL
ncbi:MAG: hypothetical protein NTY64_20175 [Deltaproteobacteria bacterium]|nr:hypothetical protein [Deltaproteobacteria bacterium]